MPDESDPHLPQTPASLNYATAGADLPERRARRTDLFWNCVAGLIVLLLLVIVTTIVLAVAFGRRL